MDNEKCMFSLIVPLYNSARDIPSLINNIFPLETNGEVLLINDGSTDDTAALCIEAAKQHSEIRFIDKPHSGVSDTRNAGLKAACGKYILFLDSDDKLKKGSILSLINFAEQYGEETDLITYPILTYYKGRLLPFHFRYETLKESGLYDLDVFPYIGQTTMNIMVRNRFENNVLFDPNMNFSEDQKYCCDILKDKLVMGFCAEAEYIYYRSETSSSGMLSGACYIFEQSMKMFEDMFVGYDNVPLAFQGLYVNDLAWKLHSNILYPYNYDKDSFDFAVSRIKSLLSRVDPRVIIHHPDINYFHKAYWLSMCPSAKVDAYFDSDAFGIKVNGQIFSKENKLEIVVVRIRVDNDKLIFRGFIKSTVFSFCEKPQLFVSLNDGLEEELPLFISAHSYYFCRTQTNNFYGFCFETPVCFPLNFSFYVKIQGNKYNCSYYFMPKSPFSHFIKRYDSAVGKYHISFDPITGTFSLDNKNIFSVLRKNTFFTSLKVSKIRRKAIRLMKKKKIHLYYDCRGVEKDNGYYKFIQDLSKNDGITRKYIYDPKNNSLNLLFNKEQMKHIIPFGGNAHKIYFLAAEKIFTAYVEDINIFPFDSGEYDLYSDFFNFECIYLQHGILHASLPWKYTPEMIFADKICVSTEYEQKLFSEKYHFRKEDIIAALMPRLQMLDRKAAPERKILFAPSWRQYLIGPDIDGIWQAETGAFINSDYYIKISALLCSEQLKSLLEKYDYTLDFKLHPIFSVYKELFHIDSERVRMVDKTDKPESYEIFLTDFSSFAFDFLYLGKKVFSFIPDKMQFECGMNSYREIEPESRSFFEEINGAEELYKLFDTKRNSRRPVFFE